jgi:hypothetical protein
MDGYREEMKKCIKCENCIVVSAKQAKFSIEIVANVI